MWEPGEMFTRSMNVIEGRRKNRRQSKEYRVVEMKTIEKLIYYTRTETK